MSMGQWDRRSWLYVVWMGMGMGLNGSFFTDQIIYNRYLHPRFSGFIRWYPYTNRGQEERGRRREESRRLQISQEIIDGILMLLNGQLTKCKTSQFIVVIRRHQQKAVRRLLHIEAHAYNHTLRI